MQPYVVKQGDCLARIAFQFGFDADAVWNDNKNADLRAIRPDPNILWPTDVLYIPDQVDKQPNMLNVDTGTTNTFTADAPLVKVSVRFSDAGCASKAFSVPELPSLTDLTTGGDGTATVSIPVTLEVFHIVFTDSGATYALAVGHLDPLTTMSGILQRLQALGYLATDMDLDDPSYLELIRAALRALKAEQSGDAAPQSQSTPDDAGLSDDGQLEDATQQLLKSAYGV
jgi:N-acetylmuramoyl-L-alanine amidase